MLDDNIMWTMTGKVTWQMTKSAQLSYFHNLQYKLIGHRGGGTFADGRARNYSDKYPTVNQLKYTTPIGGNKVFDVTYSRLRTDDAFGSRPEVQPGDIATNDTTTQISEVALPTYRANGMLRDQVRTTFSWFRGSHDIKGGYEYVNATRTSRFWSTSGLRANFANGVPTSVNTYLVQVTQSNTTYGADIAELFRYRANEHGLFIQDRWTPIRKLVLNLGLRYETNSSYQPATCRPETQFFAGGMLRQGDRAVVQVVLAALQPGLRPDRRRPDGAEVRGQPLQPAAQHQHHRAAEPDRRRQHRHQRPADVGRRQQRSHSAAERDRAVAGLRVRRRQLAATRTT